MRYLLAMYARSGVLVLPCPKLRGADTLLDAVPFLRWRAAGREQIGTGYLGTPAGCTCISMPCV